MDEGGAGVGAFIGIVFPADRATLNVGESVNIASYISIPSGASLHMLNVNNILTRTDRFVSPFIGGTVYQPWAPPGPGEYVLQTIVESTSGETLISDPITVFVVGVPIATTSTPLTGTPTKTTETPTATLTLTTPLTTTLTPTPDKAQATANQNANCREGPDSVYPVVWSFMEGQTAPIVGRNENNTWIVVDRLDGNGQCWVWTDLVIIQGNISDLPVLTAPPLPITDTPTPTPTLTITIISYSACHDYPDFGTCNEDPMGFGGCTWDTGMNLCLP